MPAKRFRMAANPSHALGNGRNKADFRRKGALTQRKKRRCAGDSQPVLKRAEKAKITRGALGPIALFKDNL